MSGKGGRTYESGRKATAEDVTLSEAAVIEFLKRMEFKKRVPFLEKLANEVRGWNDVAVKHFPTPEQFAEWIKTFPDSKKGKAEQQDALLLAYDELHDRPDFLKEAVGRLKDAPEFLTDTLDDYECDLSTGDLEAIQGIMDTNGYICMKLGNIRDQEVLKNLLIDAPFIEFDHRSVTHWL
jgi:hypothetical protein